MQVCSSKHVLGYRLWLVEPCTVPTSLWKYVREEEVWGEVIVGLYAESWRAVTFFFCFGLLAILRWLCRGPWAVSTQPFEESGKGATLRATCCGSSAPVTKSLPQRMAKTQSCPHEQLWLFVSFPFIWNNRKAHCANNQSVYPCKSNTAWFPCEPGCRFQSLLVQFVLAKGAIQRV